MSNLVSTWVWQQSPSAGTELLILLALADQSDDDGYCWPSIAYIARKTRLHEDTVNRNLRDLIATGRVLREQRPGRSNVFRIVMAEASVAAPTPPQGAGGRSAGGSMSGGSAAPPTPPQATPPPPRSASPHNHQEPSEEPSTSTDAEALDLGAASKPAGKKSRNRRSTSQATPAPTELAVTDELRAWASSKGVTADLDEATEECLDWHRARGNTFKDWEAVRRAWLRNTKKFNAVNRASTKVSPIRQQGMLVDPDMPFGMPGSAA